MPLLGQSAHPSAARAVIALAVLCPRWSCGLIEAAPPFLPSLADSSPLGHEAPAPSFLRPHRGRATFLAKPGRFVSAWTRDPSTFLSAASSRPRHLTPLRLHLASGPAPPKLRPHRGRATDSPRLVDTLQFNPPL